MSFLSTNKILSRLFRQSVSLEPESLLSAPKETPNKSTPDRIESDQPIQNSSEDRFGRWNFSSRVADVIAKRSDSQTIVIGIHAPWGEGKTSVLNMIRQRLAQYGHIEVLIFNPWRFPDETQLLKHFFKVLAAKLDSSIVTTGETVGEFLRKYSDALAPLKTVGIDASDALKAVSPIEADVETLKERVIEILALSNKRLVIVMDDIDRLQQSEIQAVFRLVKLSADFPNTAYILSFDQEIVSSALADSYGRDEQAGRSFLEKIIQVSLPLPPASIQSQMTLTIEGIEGALDTAEIELTETERRRFSDIFDKGFRAVLGTPRLSKRLGNVLTFALPLVKGEVDAVDFVLLEGIHAFYPKLYDLIRDNPQIFRDRTINDLHIRDDEASNIKVGQFIEESLAGFSETQKRAAALLLLDLFPRTSHYKLIKYPHQIDVRSVSRKRIASDEYFSRYFTYGVQPHDVSDNEVLNFLQVLADKDIDFIVETVSNYVVEDEDRAKTFIGKLRQHEDELNPEAAETLALGLALSGAAFPKHVPIDRQLGFGASPQASILIKKLLLRISEQDRRDSVAIKIANDATPLPFACDFSYWIRSLKDSDSGDMVSVVSEQCESNVKRIIADRIAAEALESSLGEKYELDAQILYRHWCESNPDNLKQYLQDSIDQNPEAAVSFLTDILQVNPTPSAYLLDLLDGRAWYDYIIKIIEPKMILDALKRTHPDAFQERKDVRGQELDSRRRTAEWFVRMHETDRTS